MTVQIIRKDGKIQGFALLLGELRVLAVGAPREELWRICDECAVNPGVVFCRSHCRYVCSKCLAEGPRHRHCEFISMAVARDLAEKAQRWAEVEA